MLDSHNQQMALIGYLAKGEYGIAGRRYFQKGKHERSHQVHAFEFGSFDVIRHLAFRDYLIAFPEIAQQYGLLKQEGARVCANNINVYCDHKDSFIKEHEAEALHCKTLSK
ncbi:hypothetical protein PSECIP111951_02537 [Pseudoalteromonas holothuriae]|uniref:Uncharacterized protein n=1 Tax=Pseudoalteromonas holothuriae TaxID=2963714 RepID=A0A9W4VT14_9GAMM|nr:hypothetical protein PSECIP111951_02537 [Pseudoalteromonas sp. CIP111951]CAH9061961.1 hypothetical protein PSECIP111854_02917 [Pseudoalteromonas sp. CIP111854]